MTYTPSGVVTPTGVREPVSGAMTSSPPPTVLAVRFVPARVCATVAPSSERPGPTDLRDAARADDLAKTAVLRAVWPVAIETVTAATAAAAPRARAPNVRARRCSRQRSRIEASFCWLGYCRMSRVPPVGGNRGAIDVTV